LDTSDNHLVANTVRDADLASIQQMIDEQQPLNVELACGNEWPCVQDQLVHSIAFLYSVWTIS
jgi:hypothetical protein